MSDSISTGCARVDDLLGGGLERGPVTQIYGPPAAGKTNLTLGAAVETAAAGGSALYLDTEGVSIDRMEQLADRNGRRSRSDGLDSDRNLVWRGRTVHRDVGEGDVD